MNYIAELRQQMGNRPLIMVGATLLALNPLNQLLMLRRTDNHCWGVPGGAMEMGETLEDTIRRETREEIGLEVSDLELFGVYSGQELFYRYPNGDEVYNVSIVYLTHIGEVNLEIHPEEHTEFQYFALQDLPPQISPTIKPILSDLVEKYK